MLITLLLPLASPFYHSAEVWIQYVYYIYSIYFHSYSICKFQVHVQFMNVNYNVQVLLSRLLFKSCLLYFKYLYIVIFFQKSSSAQAAKAFLLLQQLLVLHPPSHNTSLYQSMLNVQVNSHVTPVENIGYEWEFFKSLCRYWFRVFSFEIGLVAPFFFLTCL